MNPKRTSKNVAGDFYTTGCWFEDGECGDCLDCGLPESCAPNLLANADSETASYSHFIKQPVTTEEIEQACKACESCCVNALRYGGKSIDIINRLYNTPDYSDYIITKSGEVKYALDETGEYLPFSFEYKAEADRFLKQKYAHKRPLMDRIIECFKR